MTLFRWLLWLAMSVTLASSLFILYHSLSHGENEVECAEAAHHAQVAHNNEDDEYMYAMVSDAVAHG